MTEEKQLNPEGTKESGNGDKGVPKGKIMGILASLRLAVVIFSYLVVICIIATLLPQHQEEAFYLQNYGVLGKFIVAINLDQIFTSFWILIGGITLGINLLACTWRRLQWSLKNRAKGNRVRFTLEGETEIFNGTIEEAEAAFKQKYSKYTIHKETNDQGQVGWTGTQRKWILWGSPILHLGLCVVLVGILISLLIGQSTYEMIGVGEKKEVTVGPKPYVLQIDDFDIHYYEDGKTPQQYATKMTAMDGKEKAKLSAKVNDPAKFNHTQILQSSYGWALNMRVEDEKGVQKFTVIDGEEYWLNEREHLRLQVRFYPDYGLDNEGYIINKSNEPNNPVLLCMILHDKDPLSAESLEKGEKKEFMDGVTLEFIDFHYATGLQIKYDPGVFIIFIGFILICGGMILRFMARGKLLRVVFTSKEEGVEIQWQQTSII